MRWRPPASTLFPYTTLFRSITWPAMLMSAGIELPRKVWVHGFLLAAGGERMSKSRGNMLDRSEEHTSELQSHSDLVCRLLLEKKKNKVYSIRYRICFTRPSM